MDKIQKILYKSFDDTLLIEEQQQLQKTLPLSNKLQKEKNDIEVLRKQLNEFEPQNNEGFVDEVMKKVMKEKSIVINLGFNKILKRILISGIAAIVLLLLSIYFTEGNLSYDSLTGIAGYIPETELLSLF